MPEALSKAPQDQWDLESLLGIEPFSQTLSQASGTFVNFTDNNQVMNVKTAAHKGLESHHLRLTLATGTCCWMWENTKEMS